MLKYSILFLLFFTIKESCLEKICDKALNIYSQSTTEFIQCYLHSKTQPIKPCITCVSLYRDAKFNYETLTKTVYNTDKQCIDLFINNDKYNILLTINDFIDTLWNKGDCTDCFDWNDDANITIPNLSNLTLEFNLVLENTLDCISHTVLSEICSHCLDKYIILNTFYNNLSKSKHDKICFDSKSQMNKTRLHWSKDLNCCKDKNDSLLIFSIIGGIFVTLFLLFYVFNFIYTKRIERNYYLTENSEQRPQVINVNANNVERIIEIQQESYPSTSSQTSLLNKRNIHKKNVNPSASDDDAE